MFGLRMGSIAVVALSLISFGCSSGAKDQIAGLESQNQQLKARVSDLERELSQRPDPNLYAQMQSEMAQREARIKDLEQQLRVREPGSDPAIAGIETSYDRKKGELTVNLPSDILFAAGNADLKSTSKATLDKVIAALKKDYPGKKIRVEGHTDHDPITHSRNRWIDNLDLSLNRAAAVTRYLTEKRLDSKLISTTGFGDTRPKGGKATSRRVEIVVVVG